MPTTIAVLRKLQKIISVLVNAHTQVSRKQQKILKGESRRRIAFCIKSPKKHGKVNAAHTCHTFALATLLTFNFSFSLL
jgi:hypothetical protein